MTCGIWTCFWHSVILVVWSSQLQCSAALRCRKSILVLVLSNLGNAYYLATIFMRLVLGAMVHVNQKFVQALYGCPDIEIPPNHPQTISFSLEIAPQWQLDWHGRVYLIDTVLNTKDRGQGWGSEADSKEWSAENMLANQEVVAPSVWLLVFFLFFR